MKVILAGHNLDHAIIERIRAALERSGEGLSELDPAALTPETVSAAYARISRDPRPIPELREEALADVASARRSNRRIVFGFGHASVAEHAVFNLDVLGISRLAMEALEASRLGSYTEKSQRYILLDRDFIVPAEIVGTAIEEGFRELLSLQQNGYQEAYEALAHHYRTTQPEQWESNRSRLLLEGAAKEDARYFLGMATTGQVGVTLNARSLESTVRRMAAHPCEEVRRLGQEMHRAVGDVAPSLVRHTDATPYRRDTPDALCQKTRELGGAEDAISNRPHVAIVDASPDADALLLTSLVHGHCCCSWEDARDRISRMNDEEKRALVLESLRRLDSHEVPLRQFEIPAITFELVLSASCFAQLKRHRMASLLCQPYDPRLGVTCPPSFVDVGLGESLAEVCRRSEAVHAQIREIAPAAAPYALTNAHRRRVLFKASAREMYHLASLRLDTHAQWDIRELATEMVRLARERMPLVMMLAAGKDTFDALRDRVLRGPGE